MRPNGTLNRIVYFHDGQDNFMYKFLSQTGSIYTYKVNKEMT